MAVFSGKTIRGEQVVLDDNVYENCVLIDCKIIYRGGEVRIGFEAHNCNWSFEGAARNTMLLLQTIGMLPDNVAQMLVVPNAGMISKRAKH